MSRINIPAPALAALQAAHVTHFTLLELQLDSGTQYLAALAHNVEVDGTTYLAAQGIGSIEPVRETAAEAAGLAFTLSAVPSAAIASALAEPLQGRPVILKFVILDGTTPRLDPVAWQGTLDAPTITDGGATAEIRVTAEHALLRWQQPTGQRFADADHQQRHPGDPFFQYAAQVAQDTLVWPGKEFYRQ